MHSHAAASALATEMVLTELIDIVGEEHVSTRASDKLVYATDWSWMPQMWLDRGMQPPSPDFIVHPGSAEEISGVLRIANDYRMPGDALGRRVGHAGRGRSNLWRHPAGRQAPRQNRGDQRNHADRDRAGRCDRRGVGAGAERARADFPALSVVG